jgi:hypothetical protein
LKPRREDAPTEAAIPRRRWSNEPPDDDGKRLEGPPEVSEERVGAEVDASLRPLARALLALAEQLQGERNE